MFPGGLFACTSEERQNSQSGPPGTSSPSLLHYRSVFPPTHICPLHPRHTCSPFTTAWGAPSAVKGSPRPQPVLDQALNWSLLLASPSPPPQSALFQTPFPLRLTILLRTMLLAQCLPTVHMPRTSQHQTESHRAGRSHVGCGAGPFSLVTSFSTPGLPRWLSPFWYLLFCFVLIM